MAVTEDQVEALRTYLSARTDTEAADAERRFLTLSRTGRLDEVGTLVYSAFAAAARRRFSPHLDLRRDRPLRGRLPR